MNTETGYQNSNSTQGRKRRVATKTVINGRTVTIHVVCLHCGADGSAEFERQHGNSSMREFAEGCKQLVLSDHEDCQSKVVPMPSVAPHKPGKF